MLWDETKFLAVDDGEVLRELFQNEMQASDRREKEKADAKNSLEEYIYYMRDKLSGDFSNFIAESVSLSC